MKLRASLVALAALASVASATGITLYEDVTTKQIFTEPGENRQKVGNFIQENNVAELMSKEVRGVPVEAKVKKLEFSGTHYFGYTSANPKNVANSATGKVSNSGGFEFRRNYLQVKAYLTDKDYFRVTLDAGKELGTSANKDGATETATDTSSQKNGYAFAYVKYAYLYLDKILPYTGAEIGVAHRPWIDYEEHNSWRYRSINKVALEHKGTPTEAGPDLVNSADMGINFQTKTDYFTSEIGLFNGEGYHADKNAANQQNSTGMSVEYRLTAHPFADGMKVGKYDRTKDSYFHISTYGLNSKQHKDDTIDTGDKNEYDRTIYGLHAVYNHPYALIAGQVFKAEDKYKTVPAATDKDKVDYSGYSVNAEIRPIKDWTIIARLDKHQKEQTAKNGVKTMPEDVTQMIYGVAYKYSKNVSFIANAKNIDDKKIDGSNLCTSTKTCNDKNVYMLTAEVNW